MDQLILYPSFEETMAELKGGDVNRKLMEFIEPLPDVEHEVALIANEARISGRLAFILGEPGTGKSTFIQSLSWKRHIGVQGTVSVDATQHTSGGLASLFEKIKSCVENGRERRDRGPVCVTIDYLEYLDEFSEADVKGFFRNLNGLLRKNPVLILWPVTKKEDVEAMLVHAKAVSGTLFMRGREVIFFKGPPQEKFKDITARTIAVLNDGKDLSDFGLTYGDLIEAEAKLKSLAEIDRTMREFIQIVRERWRQSSDYQAVIRSKIPKSTEVWFVVSFREAERVVSQFVRRSNRTEDNWTVVHDKLFDYIREGQRSAIWDAKRLQLALYGAVKTRIMFLPTNTLVSCLYSYTDNPEVIRVLEGANVPSEWKNKHKAKRTLQRTSLYKQIMGEVMPAGMRRGGPAAKAIQDAEPPFRDVVSWISSGGGSDKEINKRIASALSELVPFQIVSDKDHPWIPGVIPDIFIDTPHGQICVEFHHTNRDAPNVTAGYILKKLDVYINQLESLIET